MKRLLRLFAPAGALGAAAVLWIPCISHGFSVTGTDLDLTQRHVRVFNNFLDASANDNTTPHPCFPGYVGAELAIWKAIVEWGSGPHGNGDGDPTQPNLGDGAANFDAYWRGNADSVGGMNDNVMSATTNCAGGVTAFIETPLSDGWRIRFCEDLEWHDGPGAPPPGGADLQGVATHMYGRALGLGSSNVAGATMSPTILGSAVAARSIEPDDIAGVQFIYGSKAADKPRLDSVDLSGGLLTIQGANFDLADNEVWFTEGTTLTGVPSNGSTITVAAPLDVGPGDVLVRVPGSGGDALSDAEPFDAVDDSCGTQPYCIAAPNSAGPGVNLTSLGSTSVSGNDFSLVAFGAPASVPGLFFYGSNQVQVPFGDGFRCAGGIVRRLQPPVMADAGGQYLRPVDFTQPPANAGAGAITPFSIWNFQLWYRDPMGPGGTGFNLSDGLRATFCP